MTAFAEKMKAAGVDTLGAQLTAACTDAIRHNPANVTAAWLRVGDMFGYALIRQLMSDMKPAPRAKPSTGGSAPAYQPRVIPAERLESRRKLREIIRSKYKNSGGVCWSEVGWHELSAMQRDGDEAKALLAAGPANVPNDGRTVGDVLGVKRTDEIIRKIRT